MSNSPSEHPSSTPHWAGVDVAKKSFDAAFVLAGQHYPRTPLRELPAQQFPRTLEGVRAFIQWMDSIRPDERDVRVCMEATGRYSIELAHWLLEERASLAPAIVNPQHTCAFMKSLGLRNKTDSLEARALAFFGTERTPQAYEALSPERAELRSLTRCRDALVRQQTVLKNRKHDPQDSAYVRKMETKRLRLLARDIQRIEQEMKRVTRQSPELKRDIELLQSIRGVAFITASAIMAELGDLRRFTRARQLTAFAGLSPRIIQSGTSVHGRSHLCKKGNPRVRQVLYLAAMSALSAENDLRRSYDKLLAQGTPPKSALCAISRKLLTIMRAILISGKEFDPMWKTRHA